MMINILFLVLGALNLFSIKVFANEDTWQQTSLRVPSVETNLEGFTTDAGTFRISSLPLFKAKIQITGSSLARTTDEAKAQCKVSGNSLRITKKVNKNIFKFKTSIYPFSESNSKALTVKIENLPVYEYAVASLHTSSASLVTPPVAADFENKLNEILKQNAEKIKTDGEISFELPQVDDVVCDLLLGGTQIDINFAVHLEMAKHSREVVLAPSEFAKIYEDLKSRPVKTMNLQAKAIVSGALLDQSLKNQLGKSFDDFGMEKYLKLSNVIFNPETSALQSISESNYEASARSLDILRISSSLVTLRVGLVPVVVK